jgi:hypothetical protein
MNGDRIGRQLSLAIKKESIEAIATRYRAGTRIEKKTILDEFIEVTGFSPQARYPSTAQSVHKRRVSWHRRSRARLYNEAAIAALTVFWRRLIESAESDKEAIPILVVAMERHGYLQFDAKVRQRLLTMSAATMDRSLKPVREVAKEGRRRTTV